MKHHRSRLHQLSFASLEFAQKKRVSRREKFLPEMEQVVSCARLQVLIEPKYPTAGRIGRQLIGVARVLRTYFLQQWFGLTDEAPEGAIHHSQAMREFVGIGPVREAVPDATTLLKFRHQLEEHGLTARLFEGINAHLAERGPLLCEGTMVAATIIAAPPSTKHNARTRDPEMHQTKKGNEWHFGMKAHIGADADSGLMHSLHTAAANDSDAALTNEVLHGQESQVFLDVGYTGVAKRQEILQAGAEGRIRGDIERNEAALRSTITKKRHATKDWPITRRSCIACSGWPIWCWPRSASKLYRLWGGVRSERGQGRRKGRKPAGRPQNRDQSALNINYKNYSITSKSLIEHFWICNWHMK